MDRQYMLSTTTTTARIAPAVLSVANHHVRDKFIRFYEQGHKYEILNDTGSTYTSCTTWVHSHFPKFNADLIIRSMTNGRNWKPGHKYWGMTPEDIKASWSKMGSDSAAAGTQLHARIEEFMNNPHLKYPYTHADLWRHYQEQHGNDDVINDNIESSSGRVYQQGEVSPIEWQYFLKFVQDFPELKPYRTEWTIYHEERKLAGSIDMVYENADGTLMIYDWKRVKEITKTQNWGKFATTQEIKHIPSTNFWHYALQLNTYRRIIQEKYDKKVVELCLVRLHPNNENSTYELVQLPLLDNDMDILWKLPLKEIEDISEEK